MYRVLVEFHRTTLEVTVALIGDQGKACQLRRHILKVLTLPCFLTSTFNSSRLLGREMCPETVLGSATALVDTTKRLFQPIEQRK